MAIGSNVMSKGSGVGCAHPGAYRDELECRFNNRDNEYLFRDMLLKLINSENLEYKELTAS